MKRVARAAVVWFLLAIAPAAARERNVLPEDAARAVEAAIAQLGAETPPAAAEEAIRFLVDHWETSAEPLRRAKASAQGMQLVRIVSVLETMERQHRARKGERESALRNILLAEPTLRFLLALVWFIATIVVARAARHHWVPALEGFAETFQIHVDPRTLVGIERLIEGIIVLVGTNVGVSLFVIQGLPVEAKAYYGGIRSQVFNGLFFLACGYGLLKVIDVAFDSLARRMAGADERAVRIFRNGVKTMLIAVTVLVVLENLAIDIVSLQIAAAVAGLAGALAARETLANVFGRVTAFAERAFQVGDRVVVGDIDGYVEAVGVQSTRLRTQEGAVATIPNGLLSRAVVLNLSRRPHTRRTFPIHLALTASAVQVEKAAEIVREVLSADDQVQDFWVCVTGITPRGVEIQVNVWCRQTDTRRALEEFDAIHLEIKKRFDTEGITPHLAREP